MKTEHEIDWNQYEFSKPMVVQMHDRVTDDLKIGNSPVRIDFSVFSDAKKLKALAVKAGAYDKYDKAYIFTNLDGLQNLRADVAVNHMGEIRMTVRAYGKKSEAFEIKLSFPERVALLECLDTVCVREVGSTLEALSKSAYEEVEQEDLYNAVRCFYRDGVPVASNLDYFQIERNLMGTVQVSYDMEALCTIRDVEKNTYAVEGLKENRFRSAISRGIKSAIADATVM